MKFISYMIYDTLQNMFCFVYYTNVNYIFQLAVFRPLMLRVSQYYH